MSDTPTPRTDAALIRDESLPHPIVDADFARELERENAALKAENAELREALIEWLDL